MKAPHPPAPRARRRLRVRLSLLLGGVALVGLGVWVWELPLCQAWRHLRAGEAGAAWRLAVELPRGAWRDRLLADACVRIMDDPRALEGQLLAAILTCGGLGEAGRVVVPSLQGLMERASSGWFGSEMFFACALSLAELQAVSPAQVSLVQRAVTEEGLGDPWLTAVALHSFGQPGLELARELWEHRYEDYGWFPGVAAAIVALEVDTAMAEQVARELFADDRVDYVGRQSFLVLCKELAVDRPTLLSIVGVWMRMRTFADCYDVLLCCEFLLALGRDAAPLAPDFLRLRETCGDSQVWDDAAPRAAAGMGAGARVLLPALWPLLDQGDWWQRVMPAWAILCVDEGDARAPRVLLQIIESENLAVGSHGWTRWDTVEGVSEGDPLDAALLDYRHHFDYLLDGLILVGRPAVPALTRLAAGETLAPGATVTVETRLLATIALAMIEGPSAHTFARLTGALREPRTRDISVSALAELGERAAVALPDLLALPAPEAGSRSATGLARALLRVAPTDPRVHDRVAQLLADAPFHAHELVATVCAEMIRIGPAAAGLAPALYALMDEEFDPVQVRCALRAVGR